MEETTSKQQITELLRGAETVVITTSAAAKTDEIAAAIALSQMLDKLGKRPEPVFSGEAPSNLKFLPLNILHKEFRGLRDFVIELDTSKTEADKLKYVPEGKRLKIYITPFNGSFTKEDLGFSYGEYHCDALVMLGTANLANLDKALANQKQLVDNTKLVSIVAGPEPTVKPDTIKTDKQINWHEPQASSICEMLMSLTEALQPGLLDNHIATSLLSGIVGATNHFTSSNTTPKVMTMAAQLMAAGADQGSIIKHLEKPQDVNPPQPPTHGSHPPEPDRHNELQPSREQAMPHHPTPLMDERGQQARPKPDLQQAPNAPAMMNKGEGSQINRPVDHATTPASPTPPPKFAPTPPPFRPPSPLPPEAHRPVAGSTTAPHTQPPSLAHNPTSGVTSPPVPVLPPSPQPSSPESAANTPKPPVLPPTSPLANPPVEPAKPKLDVESARKAVEEAARDLDSPPTES